MSGDEDQQQPAAGPGRSVQVGGEARVGIVGDNARVDKLNVDRVDQMQVVLAAREVTWPVAVGSAPPLASAFQDRSGVLDRVGPAGRVVVLSGDGGVGKSQLAARIYHDSPAELRVWVVTESRAAVLTGYATAAARIGLAEAGQGPEEAAEAFVDFLAGTDRSVLVVLDDVSDPGDLAGLWPGGTARVVATTRRRDAALRSGGRQVVPVGVYTPPEALAHLEGRLSPFARDLPPDALAEAEQLAEDLGWLPLGLAQAAAVVIDEGITCARYRARFADRATLLVELFPAGADADGYARTVATTTGSWRSTPPTRSHR